MNDYHILRCPSCGGWTTVYRLDTTGCPVCAHQKRR